MKGLSIKKLAAIATGVALVGTALAPVASAAFTGLAKDELYSSTGAPIVNIVVGSMAAVSDVVWAGNIAAAVAEHANVSADAACEMSGACGDAFTPSLEDLTVDITVGGETTYSTESSKTYDNNTMNSTAGSAAEWEKELTSAQLEFLYNSSDTYKFAGSSYTQTFKEIVGIEADAMFNTTPDIQDLVVMMDTSEDFNYTVTFSKGLPVCDAADNAVTSANKFVDGSNDNIRIPWFGEMYTVYQVDVTGTNYEVLLIKEASKTIYYEGDEITDLEGKNVYAGQELTVKLVAITQSAGTGSYKATFTIYDEEGTVINTQTGITSTVFLDSTFVDSEGDYVLDTILYVEDVGYETSAARGYATLTIGTDLVRLVNNKEYPYDETDTNVSNDYWKIEMPTYSAGSSPDVNVITYITVYNAIQVWDSLDEMTPLYSPDSFSSTTDTAHFLEKEEDALGYDFVKLKFDGWKGDQEITTIKIGNNNIAYKDSGDFQHNIPFYKRLSMSTTEKTFTIDNQTYYYRCDTTNASVNLSSDDTNGWNKFNGYTINTISTAYTHNGDDDVNICVTDPVYRCNTYMDNDTNVSFADVNVTITDFNVTSDTNKITVTVDGNCQFAKVSFSSVTDSDYIDTSNSYNTFYYDDGVKPGLGLTLDYNPVSLDGSGVNDQTYEYALYAAETSPATYKKIWLLLDGSTSFSVQYSKGLRLSGTDSTSEDYVREYAYYLPDHVETGGDTADNDYWVATFSLDEDESSTYDTNIYIQTDTDNIVTLPNNQLSSYGYDINYFEHGSWGMRADTPASYFDEAYTDFGSKYVVGTTYFTASIPQDEEKLKFVVLGEGTTTVTEGGDTLTVAEGDTGTTEGGTDITVDAVNYESAACVAAEGAEEPTCVAAGGEAVLPGVVPQQIVFMDTDAYSGKSIIVGGPFVNQAAAAVPGLADRLMAPGDVVAEVADSGDFVVAGYTASDTMDAAIELIQAIDALA